MEPRIAQRRKDAAEHIRRGLTDPVFNLREIAKQFILLEDHLAHPYKLCSDCVYKHLMTVEALAEEATALDSVGDVKKTSELMAETARVWIERLADKTDPQTIAGEVRAMRKELVKLVYDPRDMAERVASTYMQRVQLCSHR